MGSGQFFQRFFATFSTINVGAVVDTAIVLIATWIILGGATTAASMLFIFPSEADSASKTGAGRRALFILAVIFGSALIRAFVLTMHSRPPLPTVKVSGSENLEGTLLTHSDRFWYIFNREGELVALSDDKVETVRIFRGDD
jgi:hypothetical protein